MRSNVAFRLKCSVARKPDNWIRWVYMDKLCGGADGNELIDLLRWALLSTGEMESASSSKGSKNLFRERVNGVIGLGLKLKPFVMRVAIWELAWSSSAYKRPGKAQDQRKKEFALNVNHLYFHSIRFDYHEFVSNSEPVKAKVGNVHSRNCSPIAQQKSNTSHRKFQLEGKIIV